MYQAIGSCIAAQHRKLALLTFSSGRCLGFCFFFPSQGSFVDVEWVLFFSLALYTL